MSKKPSNKPTAASIEEHPQTGGAYIRLPDGSLVKEAPKAAPEPTGQEPNDPVADSAAAKAQEA